MQNSLLSYASIIIFSTIIAKSYNHENTFVCPPGTFFKSYPYPGDCSKFFECNNGKKTVKECSPCTAFDKKRLMCYDRRKAQCDYVKYDLNETTYAHQYDPKKYTTCENGQPKVKDCGPNELYSLKARKCLPKALVPQSDHVEDHNQKIFCQKDSFGMYPYPFRKGMYFKCVDGKLFIKQCRPGAVYNIMTKFCEGDGEPVKQFKFNETQQYIACPPGLNETFLYPFDCTKYIRCTPYGTRVETCKYGRYSIYNKLCLSDPYLSRADRVECFVGSIGYGIGSDKSYEAYLGVNCSRGLGLYKAYPHPSNWKKYVVCENNTPKVKDCPSNQVFDVETRECADKP